MKCFIILFCVIYCLSGKAQHNHTGGDGDENDKSLFKHSPQHGGEIVEAGKYKLEILVNPMQLEDKLTVFVLRKNYKEIELKEAEGSVILKYNDGQIDTLNLTKCIDRFTTNQIDASKMVNMLFNIKINKHNVSGAYFYKGIIKN